MKTFRLFSPVQYFFLLGMSGLLVASCSKNEVVSPKKEFVQYFKAVVDDKEVLVKNKIDSARTVLSGQWTGIGNAGQQVQLYTVNVWFPKAQSGTQTKLSFQIEGIKTGLFKITGQEPFSSIKGSYIYLSKSGVPGEDIYTANTQKAPFTVKITKYEYPQGSIVPIVGGELSGTLYSKINPQDSVVLRNGAFEVRY